MFVVKYACVIDINKIKLSVANVSYVEITEQSIIRQWKIYNSYSRFIKNYGCIQRGRCVVFKHDDVFCNHETVDLFFFVGLYGDQNHCLLLVHFIQ